MSKTPLARAELTELTQVSLMKSPRPQGLGDFVILTDFFRRETSVYSRIPLTFLWYIYILDNLYSQ